MSWIRNTAIVKFEVRRNIWIFVAVAGFLPKKKCGKRNEYGFMLYLPGIAQCTPSSTTLMAWFSPFRLSSIANTPRSLLAPGKIRTLVLKAVFRIRIHFMWIRIQSGSRVLMTKNYICGSFLLSWVRIRTWLNPGPDPKHWFKACYQGTLRLAPCVFYVYEVHRWNQFYRFGSALTWVDWIQIQKDKNDPQK